MIVGFAISTVLLFISLFFLNKAKNQLKTEIRTVELLRMDIEYLGNYSESLVKQNSKLLIENKKLKNKN